jgi:hypothetical protein
MENSRLCGETFKGDSWKPWKAVLKAIHRLPMSPEEIELFQRRTQRENPPETHPTEVGIVAARRSGKSVIAALKLVHATCAIDWRAHLAPGELAVGMCISPDRDQSRIILNATRALLHGSTVLEKMIVRETGSLIELNNQTSIQIGTASSATIRGRSVCCAILDEAAFLNVNAAESQTDERIHTALLPSLATLPGSMLWMISSPSGKQGLLWRKYQESFGKPDPSCLMFQAPAGVLNPTLPQSILDEAKKKDPIGYRSEWGAEFCETSETYISEETLRAHVEPGVAQRPPQGNTQYIAFMDAASGSGRDSMVLAIATPARKGKGAILCATITREPPFVPTTVAQEFAAWAMKYGTRKIYADAFASGWIESAFKAVGITIVRSPKSKSELYETLLPALNSGQIALTDYGPLIEQLSQLERRILPSGRTAIDHSSTNHDDIANAACGALVMAHERSGSNLATFVAPVSITSSGSGNENGAGQSYDYGDTRRPSYDPGEYERQSGVAVGGGLK